MDYIGFVEACYRLDATTDEWLLGLARAGAPFFDRGYGTVAMVSRVEGRTATAIDVAGDHAFGDDFVRRLTSSTAPAVVELAVKGAGGLQHGGTLFRAAAEAEGREITPGFAEDYWNALGAPDPVRDHVALFSLFHQGYSVTVAGHSPDEILLSESEVAIWRRLSWHLGAAWRLRQGFGRGEVILDPSGRVQHAEDGAKDVSTRAALRDHVLAIERARTQELRARPLEAVNLWTGLVDGRFSLVDRFDSDGRRYLVAHVNPHGFSDPRALTDRERDCAQLAARGSTNSQIGYGMGLSESTVASHVARALQKLGLRRRSELASLLQDAWSAWPAGDDPELAVATGVTAFASPRLTEAENAVVSLVRQGLSNREIARARRISTRTVANQLAAVYRKLDVASRTHLCALDPPAPESMD